MILKIWVENYKKDAFITIILKLLAIKEISRAYMHHFMGQICIFPTFFKENKTSKKEMRKQNDEIIIYDDLNCLKIFC